MQLYKGDLLSKDAWEMLKDNPKSYLIDVRTAAEWNYVGFPDLSPIGKQTVFLDWLTLPNMEVNDSFAPELMQIIPDKNAELIFICRTGGRSRQAAILMTQLGYSTCYNLESGFEGELDPNRHRGNINGWKAESLPWRQK